MSEKTVNLALPYIMPAQAQKHVTHNEALQRLDATVQLVITARQASPPALPIEGECFWVLAGATGPWSGRTGRLAFRQDGEWLFIVPQVGWCAFDRSDERLKIFSGADWIDPPPARDHPVDGTRRRRHAGQRQPAGRFGRCHAVDPFR